VLLSSIFALLTAAYAQPWPLIRLRQTPEANSQRLEQPANSPDAGIQVIGMNSLTGRAETCQFETHLSFAGMEEFDATNRPDDREDRSQALVLVYRHWWSHRPQEALQALRKARYIQDALGAQGAVGQHQS